MSSSISNWEKAKEFLTDRFGRMGTVVFWTALLSIVAAAAFVLVDLTQQIRGIDDSAAGLLARLSGAFGAFLLLLVIVLYFYLRRKKCVVHTVHVVLPMSGLNRGDGLLQLAGFLAAWDQFARLEFKFHDSRSSPSSAVRIVQDIFANDDGKPIWIVVTMSATAALLHGVLERNVVTPEQRERCTIISTISVAPGSPHRPEKNLYRFSLDGLDEASAFWNYLKNDFDRTANGVLLLALDSTYPRATCGELAAKVIDNKKSQCNIPMKIDGTPFSRYDLREYVEDGFGFNRAVIIGYDLALFKSIEYVVEHGFSGKIIFPTTMSVPDWQKYMRDNLEHLFKDGIEYFYLSIDDALGAQEFNGALANWNLAAIKEEKNLENTQRRIFDGSGCHPNTFQSQFDNESEAQIYADIQPNYVSAHCYEVCRFIDLCIGTGADRIVADELARLVKSFNETPGALGEVVCDDRGIRPLAQLSVEPLLRIPAQ